MAEIPSNSAACAVEIIMAKNRCVYDTNYINTIFENMQILGCKGGKGGY
ncbi:MAG: hypothetical protein F6K52_34155 [Moorea sp. SIO3H5]|nr:hypothetical protein [Moorena sp. SIO3H5]